jgi:hypothetical protein
MCARSGRAAGIRCGGAPCRAVQPAGLGRPAGAPSRGRQAPSVPASASCCRADVGLFFISFDGVWLALQPGLRGKRRSRSSKTATIRSRATECGSSGARPDQFHPRLPLCPLCHRRRRADAGAGVKSRGRRRGSVTCGAEYAAGAEFRLASRQCHVHRAHLRPPNVGALHWDPFCFDPAPHLDGWCAGKGSPQFDLGER